jgi:1,5-anhydro-D-fructose reductase (1,5-anhydro-D-mannitol-forming)
VPSEAPEASSRHSMRAERLLDARERVLVESQTLGWGIVGLGRIAATEIAPAITASPGGALVTVVSRDQGRAEAFAREHGAASALDDYAKMLADPAVQAVYIATPNAQHPEQVIAAARAGKHVLCDKPLAVTAADARRCVEECRSAGVGLGITFQTRFYDGMAEAAALVRDGGIGRVVTAEAQIGTRGNLPKGWRTDPALAGMGTLNNIGVHALDILRYLIGSEVSEVAAMTGSEPGYEVDTTDLVLLRFANGTLAQMSASQAVPHPRDDIALYGTDGRVLAPNLSRPDRGSVISFITCDGEREFPASSRDSYLRLVEAFAAAVTGGRDPSPSGEDGLRSVELTAAIADSIRQGRVISLAAG